MKRARLLRLGVQLATAGGRPAWIRLGLTAAGFMIGSALLLAAASIVPGVHAMDVRRDTTEGIGAVRGGPGALRVWLLPQSVGGIDIPTHVVRPIRRAPVPPGLPRVPAPGEMFVSARLAALWPSIGPSLEERLHGHLAGTIGPDGVIGPDEVSIWMGKPAGVPLRRSGSYRQEGFGPVANHAEPMPLGALLIVVVVTSALLLPIWLFVATVTRLSAATRETRLAAVRLAGATETQVRFLAASEAGVAAAIGAWLGVPLFLAIRPILASGPIGGLHMYPTDLAPPPALMAIVLIALPGLAIVMALSSMRRITLSPLGVTRHAARSHAGWRWILVLGAGLAGLAWSASRHGELQGIGTTQSIVLVCTSVACIGFGLIGTAMWTAWAIAHRLAGSIRSVPAMLGFRRLEAEPSSVQRVVGGVALLIALVAIVQSGLISVERSEGPAYLPMEASVLSGDEIGVLDATRGDTPVRLNDIPGVTSVRWTRKIQFGRSGSPIGIVDWDGNPATLEAIRDRLAWTGASVQTLPQIQTQAALANDDYSSFRRGAMAITLFLLSVSAVTLLVAMVDWLMERRRSLAVLSAVGVANATVRSSILVQVALPLTTSLTFGVAGAIVVTALMLTALNQPVVFVPRQLAILVGAVALVVLGVTAASTPWLRITRNPALLREA
jgi:hypothetical protein